MRKLALGLVVLIIAWAISIISGCESPTSLHMVTGSPIAPPPAPAATAAGTAEAPVPLVEVTKIALPPVMAIPTATDTPIAPPPVIATPSSTPAMTPTLSMPRAEVVVPTLNVREGPGVDYPIIGAASAGDVFGIVGINPSGDWLKVVTADGSLGWISGRPAYTRVLGSLDDVPVVQPPPPLVTSIPTLTDTPIAPPPGLPTDTPIAPPPVTAIPTATDTPLAPPPVTPTAMVPPTPTDTPIAPAPVPAYTPTPTVPFPSTPKHTPELHRIR